jgi:hypothetical protein
VTYRAGLSTRPATLLDLSSRGCRLLSRTRIERGKRIKVQIPEALEAGDDLLVVPARVVHVEAAEIDGAEMFRIGLAFERVDEDTQNALAILIEDRARGPLTLRANPPGIARPRATAKHTERAISVDDRRGRGRAAYSQTIPAFGERALRVLVGRDLSVGGMRVQPQPELWLGDRLQLAIYGEAGDDPMLIWGRVERSDGERGLLVRFEPLDRPRRRASSASLRACPRSSRSTTARPRRWAPCSARSCSASRSRSSRRAASRRRAKLHRASFRALRGGAMARSKSKQKRKRHQHKKRRTRRADRRSRPRPSPRPRPRTAPKTGKARNRFRPGPPWEGDI